ncbi:MAG: hypothetical protein AB7J13_09665 [Pyrinomonadaceae bacterium]
MENAAKLGSTIRQAWFGLALWMTFGLLIEGLIGFRSPAYLQDPVRRELFRLAHAHGALLSLLLLIAALFIERKLTAPPKIATTLLRLGVIVMPLGFLLGGVWHYESDPGMGIFLAPIGGVLVIFGVIATAFSVKSE